MKAPVWEFIPAKHQQIVNNLREELNVPGVIAKLLVDRGVDSYEKAKKFFRPKLADLHDPFLMEDMQRAVERIDKAVQTNEKILIYGDYDVDGTTSVALVYSYLLRFYPNVEHYQPDRYTEGYGISFQGVEYAKQNNFTLVIALDCGTKANDKIAKANEYGIDFIIADHHTPGEQLPDAYAILNPKKTSCSYPYKELCGCGIGFKLIQAYQSYIKQPFEAIIPFLDLVAIAIGADIVPVTGENRVLAYFGLIEIEKTERVGIKTILRQTKANKKPTISDLVFKIAPRINAAGRISSARKAVELLLSTNDEDAQKWVELINAYNSERQSIDKSITKEALEILDDENYSHKKSIVISNSNWHKGVVGIVASRIVEHHYKPTIVLVESNGEATGSARSVKGFNIYNAINNCKYLLERFGGHKYAAGLTVKLENLPDFIDAFENEVKKTITPKQETPVIQIDAKLTPLDFKLDKEMNIFPKFYRLLKQMAPFGPGNMNPVFFMDNLIDTGYSRIVKGDHLKLNLKTLDGSKIFNGIGFGLGHKLEVLKQNKPVEIVFHVGENTFMNQTELQLVIKDIRLSKEAE